MTLYNQPVDLIDFLSSCKILLGVGLGHITDSLGGGFHTLSLFGINPFRKQIFQSSSTIKALP